MDMCEWCGAPLLWVHLPGERFIYLDAEPHPDGNIAVEEDRWSDDGHRLMPRGRIVTDDTPRLPGLEDDREPRYRPHFATCPQAYE